MLTVCGPNVVQATVVHAYNIVHTIGIACNIEGEGER